MKATSKLLAATILVLLVAVTALPSHAQAGSALSGLTVNANWDYPTLSNPYEGSSPSSAVVGPSDASFVFAPNTAMNIGVSASSNTITLDGEYNGCGGTCNGGPYDNSGGVTFNGFVISVVNPPPGYAFNSVQIQSINWGIQVPQISFDATHIYVNMEGLAQIGPGSQIVLNYNFAGPYSICALYDQTKSVHSGAVIPIKLQLCDINSNDVSSSSIVVHATSLTGVSGFSGDVEPAGDSNPDNDFRFDATLGTTGGYIFNLSTSGLATGTYNLQFTAGSDPTVHSVNFGVK